MMTGMLIGLTGPQESGKTTAAKHLRERHGFAGSNLTDPMDEMLAPLMRRMRVPEHEILPRLSGGMKNVPIPGFEWLTGRKLKQALGYQFRDAISRPVGDGTDSAFWQDIWDEDNRHHPRRVHEQVRYPFEAAWIRAHGGIVIELVDPDATSRDDHPSEVIGFPVDHVISNPKTGTAALHARLDEIVGERAGAAVAHADADSPVAALERDAEKAFLDHGREIRAYADRLDAGDEAMSEELDDVAAEMKGSLGALAANRTEDEQAEYALAAVEEWVTANVSNAGSDRRVAAAFAFLGVEEARRRLG